MENQTENNTTEKVLHLTKNGLDKSIVRSIVIKTTETLLPIVFWGLLEIPCQSDKIISRIDNGRAN